MTVRTSVTALVSCLCLGSLVPTSFAVELASVVEMKGGGAAAGSAFRNGYRLAIEEINAAGGILGEQITIKEYEIETKPDAAAEATKEAIAKRPFAILGPAFSGITIGSLRVSRESGIPQFTAGEAASISRLFPLSLYRTTMSQRAALPRLATFVVHGLQAKKVAIIWVDNEYGRDGRDALVQSITRYGATFTLNTSIKVGEKDFTDVVKQANAADCDAIILYATEAESPDLLKQLRASGFNKPIVGDGPLVSQKLISQVGSAAEGIYGHVPITVEAPDPRVRGFVERYTRRYNNEYPDHNSVKGYFAVQVIKVVAERVKSFDRAAFNEIMQTARIETTQLPQLINSATYYIYGDMNRQSYLTQVKGGKLNVIATFPINESFVVTLPNGKSANLRTKEGQALLLGETKK